jgi:hypothetical protein
VRLIQAEFPDMPEFMALAIANRVREAAVSVLLPGKQN